jgi:hypothetical protein
MTTTKSMARLGLAEPEQRQRHPADARQALQAERQHAQGVAQKPARGP